MEDVARLARRDRNDADARRVDLGRRSDVVSAAMVRAQAAGQALQGERGAPEVGGARLSISMSNIGFVGFLH